MIVYYGPTRMGVLAFVAAVQSQARVDCPEESCGTVRLTC